MRMIDLQNKLNVHPLHSVIDQGQLWMENNLQFDYNNARKQRWTVAGNLFKVEEPDEHQSVVYTL